VVRDDRGRRQRKRFVGHAGRQALECTCVTVSADGSAMARAHSLDRQQDVLRWTLLLLRSFCWTLDEKFQHPGRQNETTEDERDLAVVRPGGARQSGRVFSGEIKRGPHVVPFLGEREGGDAIHYFAHTSRN
jgi:hypothetical protein